MRQARCIPALAALLLAAGQPRLAAQAPHGNDARTFAPLRPGARWTWRTLTTTDVALPPTESRLQMTVVGAYRDGEAVRYLVQYGGDEEGFEHWSLARDGVVIRVGESAAQVTPIDPDAPARLLLACPVGAVTRWCCTERLDRREVEWQMRIESFRAPTTVPIGRFEALQLVATDDGRRLERRFAPGVGLVREAIEHGDRSVRRELLEFEPGPDLGPLRQALMQVHLPPDWAWSPRMPTAVRWLDQGVESLCLPGWWALWADGGTRRCAFVSQRMTCSFDALDGRDWVRLLDALDLRRHPPAPETFARLVARLVAHQLDESILELGTLAQGERLREPLTLPVRTYRRGGGVRHMQLDIDLGRPAIRWTQR